LDYVRNLTHQKLIFDTIEITKKLDEISKIKTGKSLKEVEMPPGIGFGGTLNEEKLKQIRQEIQGPSKEELLKKKIAKREKRI